MNQASRIEAAAPTNKELLEMAARAIFYDPETGEMRWHRKHGATKEERRWNTRYADMPAGTKDDKGYIRILFKSGGKTLRVRAHQLAWLITTGESAKGEIDHINQNKMDNRIVNLRDVPKEINQRNGTRKKNNTSGVPGVTWHKQHRKWYAQARINGKHHSVGLYLELSDAETAVKASRAQHGFTETHGRSV